MCLAIPALIMEVAGDTATVDMAGVSRCVSLMLLPDARRGEYVIVHAGFAMERLDEQEALRTLDLFRQIDSMQDASG